MLCDVLARPDRGFDETRSERHLKLSVQGGDEGSRKMSSIVCIALGRHLVFDRQELGKIQMF